MNRASIEELKGSISISSVAAQYTQLRRCSRELVGRCPLHADSTPSFFVNDEKGKFHCFGCGAFGDVIELVMRAENLEFGEAVERLAGGTHLSNSRQCGVPKVTHARSDKRAAALKIWNKSFPLEGTAAEAYLRKRGIVIDRLPDLQALRFARLPYQGSQQTHPTLVAAAHDWSGNFVGIQRTFLTPNGGKLDVDTPKMSLSRFHGGAIQFGKATDEVVISEGIEDALTVLMAVPGAAAWVTAGANRMKSLELPPTCTSVVIAADNDPAGVQAAQEAAEAMERRGKAVRIMRPKPQFKDFNSQLMSEISL